MLSVPGRKDFDKEKYDVRVVIPNYMCKTGNRSGEVRVCCPFLYGHLQARTGMSEY